MHDELMMLNMSFNVHALNSLLQVSFQRNVNIKEICWNLNNIRLRDCDMGAIVNRDLSRRIRPVGGIAQHKQVGWGRERKREGKKERKNRKRERCKRQKWQGKKEKIGGKKKKKN